MEDTLCDFVDAGSGKECSDVKIRGEIVLSLDPKVKLYLTHFPALFEHSFLDVHCQHIIFCGSADNGYARILGPHRDSDRISLVEGPPFAHEMRQLAADFETTSFPQVFRSKKLSKQVSLGTPAATPTLTPPRTPIPNYASVARKTPLMSNESSSVSNLPTGASATSNIQLLVCQNAQGQRVDSPLEISTKGKLEVLKRHKFCNQFHILGSCFWGTSCNHKHGTRLVGQDVIDLMCIARLSACPRGLQCDDERCVNGHGCPRWGCPGLGCSFPHEVDTRIVTSN